MFKGFIETFESICTEHCERTLSEKPKKKKNALETRVRTLDGITLGNVIHTIYSTIES